MGWHSELPRAAAPREGTVPADIPTPNAELVLGGKEKETRPRTLFLMTFLMP